ncbi:MAG TPA: hypothetical protein PKE32_07900 [Miltoncostaeaceae bacterium]|nr:hypothetical protein [Miltoncostaeaceae bacterium]
MDDELDLGEAAEYILAQRRGLDEDLVWGVLRELGGPPERANEALALSLLATVRPDIRKRDAKRVLREWRAYAELARESDWDDEYDDV